MTTLVLDAIHYNVRDNGVVVKKAAYVAIGTDLEGRKDVLGIWLGAAESSKYWLSVLNGLKSRGVRDILIASVDGLQGFVEAINAAFPKTEIQRCIVHLIRSSTRYVSWKDLKEFTQDLKPIYKAATEELALEFLADLEAKWGEKYPISVKSWRDNWNEGGCGRLFGLLRRRIQGLPVFHRTLRTQRYLDSFSVIPVQVLIQCVHELVDAHSKPFPVVIHLVLEPSEESFAGGIIRRTAFPGHRT